MVTVSLDYSFQPGILRDKTMNDKSIYIPNHKKYPSVDYIFGLKIWTMLALTRQ